MRNFNVTKSIKKSLFGSNETQVRNHDFILTFNILILVTLFPSTISFSVAKKTEMGKMRYHPSPGDIILDFIFSKLYHWFIYNLLFDFII